MGIHNHQPVGNFERIFQEAFDKCYYPFLSILKDFPFIKCAIHNSGPLYDWMPANQPKYLQLLKDLVNRGQVEIISGGYYEPILPLVCDEDKAGQINLMNDFIKSEFKNKPSGLWLAERVWEPYLARVINSAGLKYTFLDDTHFRYAGCRQKEFFGYYSTEDAGKPIDIFPISKTLRYKVPFSQAHEAVDILRSFRRKDDVLVTLFDDGEKFGLWPHTYDWVYGKEWLRKFFSMIENSGFIEMITPRQALERFTPNGIVYLPTASYEEMGEWVLAPDDYFVYEELNNFLKVKGKFDEFKDFLRGGFFRNFYRKYPRLNYMHKRMLYLSGEVNRLADIKKDKNIFIDLWKAQTNCGYWHGIFGGFYLGHIRATVYENLIKAQNLLDKKFARGSIAVDERDFDFDGVREFFVKNKDMLFCFSPRGGAFREISLRSPAFSLSNTVTRCQESYHKKIQDKENKSGKLATIHNISVSKEQDLDKFLIYDKYERLNLIDHFLDKKITLDDFYAQHGIVTLSDRLYDIKVKKSVKQVEFNCRRREAGIDFTKKIKFYSTGGFEAEYKFNNKNFFSRNYFGIEFNLSFLSLSHIFKQGRGENIALSNPGSWKDERNFSIIDEHKEIIAVFDFDRADIFAHPLYSVSSSESGFEKVYQQIVILFIVKGQKNNFNLSFLIKKS